MTMRVPHRDIADRRERVAKAICRTSSTASCLMRDLPCIECIVLAEAAIAAMFIGDEGPKR